MAILQPIFDGADGACFFPSKLRFLGSLHRPVIARRRHGVQPKELEALDHVPLDPRQQPTDSRFSGFVEGALSIFSQTFMFLPTVFRKLVVPS